MASYPILPYIAAMDSVSKFPETLAKDFPELAFAQNFPSLDSTNLEAKRRAESGAKAAALVTADTQTAGRGRMGRSWESPSGKGLYFSLLLRPRLKPAEATLITLAAGLSVATTLKKMEAEPILIKWPNDVLLQGKKIAGILCEMKSTQNGIEYVVVGIGINLTQKPEDFSPEVSKTAGSLEFLTGKEWAKEKVLKNFLQVFFPELKNLETGGSADLIRRWEKESEQLGRMIRVISGGQRLEGKAIGLNPQGYLRLELEEGVIQNLIDEETTLL